mgnify:CR=1 FL=1
MLKFFETNSSKLSEITFQNKFKDKKIISIGSGPSVNDTNWENLDYDYITTTSFFYLNDKLTALHTIMAVAQKHERNHPELYKENK